MKKIMLYIILLILLSNCYNAKPTTKKDCFKDSLMYLIAMGGVEDSYLESTENQLFILGLAISGYSSCLEDRK